MSYTVVRWADTEDLVGDRASGRWLRWLRDEARLVVASEAADAVVGRIRIRRMEPREAPHSEVLRPSPGAALYGADVTWAQIAEVVTDTDRALLSQLLPLYWHDVSPWLPTEMRADGRYAAAAGLPATGYLLRTGDDPVGFALVAQGDEVSLLSEFFILGPFRRKGLGGVFAREVLRRGGVEWSLRALPGVSEAFWHRVVSAHTDGLYETRAATQGTVFRFGGADSSL